MIRVYVHDLLHCGFSLSLVNIVFLLMLYTLKGFLQVLKTQMICKAFNIYYRFSKKFNLQNHQKRAHPKELNNIKNGLKCPHCSCVYSNAAAVKKHIRDYHKKEQNVLNESPTPTPEIDDPQREAENVLKQLMILQNDIEASNVKHTEQTIHDTENTTQNVSTELTSIDESLVELVTINDRLYPFGEIRELRVQQVKRSDGLRYLVCEYCSKEFLKSYSYLRLV